MKRSQFPLVNPAKASKRGYTNSGVLAVNSATVIRVPTFLEYVQGGCSIQLAVAVDFTGSNGDPRLPSSLHYINPAAPNEYMSAMASCGSVLLEYDSDKQVSAFGFGGSVAGAVNHCFALNSMKPIPMCPAWMA